MSAPDDTDQAAVQAETSCSSSEATSSRHPSSPPKEGEPKRAALEPQFHTATTLEEMLMTPPFDMAPDAAADVLSSLAEAPPSGQGLADILPTSFLSQLVGKLPEGLADATLPHLPLGLHSPLSDRPPLTPSHQTSADSSLCYTPQTSLPDSVAGTPVERGVVGTPVERGVAGTPVERGVAGTPVERGVAGTPVERGVAGTPVERGVVRTPVVRSVSVEASPKVGGPRSSGGSVSTRTTKRTRSDDVTLLKSGADTRSSKRSKSESLPVSRKSSATAKKATRSLGSAIACVKDLGRWRPTDDMILINAVEQTNDLAAVHLGAKFSCQFSLKEIEARWQALVYDKHISRLSVQALLSVQPGVVPAETTKALWSDEEEQILSTIPSTNLGELKTFQSLLDDTPGTFHCTRTARSLQYHWALMRHMCLLCDQDVGYIPADGNLASFAEWMDELEDSDLIKPRTSVEEALDQELALADRRTKREVTAVENDLAKWEDMLGLAEGECSKPGVLAVFRGQNTCFEMLSKEIVIGRGSVGGEKVNIDLMREVPNSKVSRKQAIVKVDKNGDLVLKNVGRRPVYVHGKPVLTGQSTKLEHRQVIEICSISLTVYIKMNKTAPQTAACT